MPFFQMSFLQKRLGEVQGDSPVVCPPVPPRQIHHHLHHNCHHRCHNNCKRLWFIFQHQKVMIIRSNDKKENLSSEASLTPAKLKFIWERGARKCLLLSRQLTQPHEPPVLNPNMNNMDTRNHVIQIEYSTPFSLYLLPHKLHPSNL